MTALLVINIMLVALCTATIFFAWVAVQRSLMWQQRYREVLDRPLEFWVQRERNRKMMEALRAVRLDSFATVKFRRPQPFDEAGSGFGRP